MTLKQNLNQSTVSQKDLRDDLAIAYVEEIVNLKFLPRLIYNACTGYKNVVDKKHKHRTV